LQGRLKSLYSIHKKMLRKGVGLDQIYDARALRVVIDDGGNRQDAEAIMACYQVPTRHMEGC
jgi:(p)ppGpp synthase/HD superfamily hydrolase